MAGRHSRTRIFSSPAGIVATAAAGVALAVGGTVGAVQLTSGSDQSGQAALDL
ncbi:septal ring lytic transglycosylase RlpA family lipoprotein, partial [Micromonospora parva]